MGRTKLDRIWRVPAISWPRDYMKTGDAGDSLLGSGPVADQSGQRCGPGPSAIRSICQTMRPLVVAEQFGTVESLYRGRIDLGLGRAPGTDQRTARALRRDLATTAENFPHDVMELQALLGPLQPDQMVRAVPSAGLRVPIWLLGSSTFSAQLAAMLGLPFAFASHFCPFGADAGARCISRPLSAVGTAFRALRDGWRQCLRRRYRCRGAASHHIAATAIRQPATRTPGPL